MPRASAVQTSQRVELKSCPGGWVELRQMTWDEVLKRRDIAGRISYEGQGRDTKATQEMMLSKLTEMDFRLCIIDHNLFRDDEETDKYDFGKPGTYSDLNPRIGEEINQAINKMNVFEEDDAKNYGNGSEPA